MNELDKKQENLLNTQNIASLIFIITIIISIYLTLDEKAKLYNKSLINDDMAIKLSIFNRTLVLILSITFLITSYQNTKIARKKGKKILSYFLQNRASELTVISSIIVLYVVLSNINTNNFNVSKVENPTI